MEARTLLTAVLPSGAEIAATPLAGRQVSDVIAMAVEAPNAVGTQGIVYADRGQDRVWVDFGGGHSQVIADRATGLVQPGAVALADLNGNGLSDLIVADTGSNRILIFPGLSDGGFGPAIGGGYSVGANPAGITVASLSGGLPDLVIADRGSDQVSILVNQSQVGGPIGFASGPVLASGGSGPVSTVVGSFTVGASPDLLVTNSGSNSVAMLPGIGTGVFGVQAARSFAVGSDPTMSVVGHFDGQLDLVTIDAGSSTLTIISGFTGPSPIVSTVSSGGLRPTMAFAFDAGGGYQDLMVLNSGDRTMALFKGGPEGLTLASVLHYPGVLAPTAIAFSSVKGGTVEFYVATAGHGSAELVSMSLHPESLGGGSGLAGGTSSVQLVAVNETSLPLVATVLTLTIPVPGDELGPTTGGLASAGSTPAIGGPGPSVGQGPGTTSRPMGTRSGGGSGDAGEAEEDAAEAPAGLAPWERYVLGVDEAIEQLGRDGASVLADPAGPADRPAPPSTPGLAPATGAGLRSIPAARPATEGPARVAMLDRQGPREEVGPIDAVAADPAMPSSRSHGRRLTPAIVGGLLVAVRWGTLRFVGRPVARGPARRSPVRRRPHGLI